MTNWEFQFNFVHNFAFENKIYFKINFDVL